MNDIFEPKFHKAWNEALIKENKIRMKWYQDYGSKLEKSTEDISISEAGDGDPSCTCKDNLKWSKVPDKKVDWPREGATGTSTILRVADNKSAMKVPTAVVKSKLYEGISRDGKGRAGYLKSRLRDDPEDKFRDRVCTSWDYGWNLNGENELGCIHPDQCKIKERAFYRS